MKKILVIEDEIPVRSNLLELLTEEGFQTLSAEDGLVGVSLAHKEFPDLIICDVMMPELDGYEVLNLLQQDSVTANIPFIFLTAKADRTDLRQGMQLGADDYLTKPFTRAELLSAIDIRLNKQQNFKQQAEEKMQKLRSNLAHALPHELNTPLSVVLLSSELLLEHGSTMPWPQVQQRLEQIQSNATRLQRMVQNFLLYAELEITATDPWKLKTLRENSTGSTAELIEAVARRQAGKAGRTEDLQMELAKANVQMSGLHFKKIVEELVDNTLRYSLAGTPIRLHSVIEGNTLVLYVMDKGQGMTAEQLVEIGAYIQFDRKLHEQQGSGLGLTIAKRLAELHGGELNIVSLVGVKTVVRVVLPLTLLSS